MVLRRRELNRKWMNGRDQIIGRCVSEWVRESFITIMIMNFPLESFLPAFSSLRAIQYVDAHEAWPVVI